MKHQTITTASGKADAPRSLKDALAPALAAARKRDVIDVRQPTEPRLGPTPEQRAKADYARKGGKVEKGQVGVAAYTRQYLFEKLAKTHSISEAGLAALRFYRKAHEEHDASPTRCALNDEGRGGGVPLCLPFSISGMFLEDLAGGTLVDALERCLGHTLTTVRAVALEDHSFSTVAIARFGSRVVPWIEQEQKRRIDRNGNKARYVDKVVPISGRHRQIIADEFELGVERLIEAHRPYASTERRPAPPRPTRVIPASDEEIALMAMVAAPAPAVDPAFLDDAGRLLQMSDIADIIRDRVWGPLVPGHDPLDAGQ